jgi:hypothetical protein
VTKLAVLYIESFGNPRKFARTARRVDATMPVLTLLAGRFAGGRQTADRPAAPLVSREALFEQAGVIITRGYGELISATALLGLPRWPSSSGAARTDRISVSASVSVSGVSRAAWSASTSEAVPLSASVPSRLVSSPPRAGLA